MRGLRLVHEGTVTVQGEEFEVKVFCREDGRHFAKTSFSESDVIINDGQTLDDVLNRHRELLPLAVSSRRMRSEIEV
ncbi:MAG: hypothetical protein Fur0034_16170 [Desulfuromonadia bacterium]